MKVLTIILGVLMLAMGVYCLITPVETYAALGWLIGLSMLVEGVGGAVSWNDRRKLGFADGWTLAGSVISILLGCFLLFSYVAQYAIDLFIAYIIAAWLFIAGITRIIAAFRLRDYQYSMGTYFIGSSWTGLLALGIVITLLGILSLINPVTIMAGIGIMLGIIIICIGAGILARGLRMQ